MTKLDFPITGEAITPQWLTSELRARGLLSNGEIEHIELAPLSDPGQTADLFRLTPRYVGDASDAPATLVAKVPTTHEGAKALSLAMQAYEKEIRFYRHFRQESALPIPTCYAAEIDESGERFVLILEDLGNARNGALFSNPITDIERGLTGLAALHARFWGKQELLELPWVQDKSAEDWVELGAVVFEQVVAGVRGTYEHCLSPNSWSVVEHYRDNYRSMKVRPRDAETLVHSDAHAKQMFFPSEKLDRFVIFDWQAPSYGIAAHDVSRLLVLGVTTDERRQHEDALLAHYLDALRSHGVTDLNAERLRYGVRLTTLNNLFINMLAALQTDTEILGAQARAEGTTWEEGLFGRLGAAIDDWDTRAVIDQMVRESAEDAG